MREVPPIQIDENFVQSLISELAKVGQHSGTGVWRTVYSPEWVRANGLFSKWSTEAGLTVDRDAVGNVWATHRGVDAGPAIVSGSHIDSQCPGGRYDGTLGILAALIAIKALKEQFGQPRKTLQAVSLCEEEGSRFPSANFWGSRGITGKIRADEPSLVKESSGNTIGEAMRQVGLDPARIAAAKRNDISTFIELHIEQGPILEQANVSTAVVEAITGVRHTAVTLTGVENHAGAFPMDLRLDPMAGFAEIASGLIDHAHRMGRPAVTTIGSCEVYPGAAAIIPRHVKFTVDARHPDPDTLLALHKTHEVFMKEVAARRGLGIDMEVRLDKQPCVSAPQLVALLDDVASSQGVKTIRVVSGAGHDAQQMASIADVAMIFVQSKNGRSHTELEYSSIEHIVDGIRVLAAALYALAY
jgi:allantoate deiminase